MKTDLILNIHVDKANLQHIAETGVINGTLLNEIKRVMDLYARKAFNEGTKWTDPVDFVFDNFKKNNP